MSKTLMTNSPPPSSDPAEIAKFNALAQEWWDPNGKMGPLHAINPIRFEFINKHSPVKGKRVLDLGCGAGILAEALAKAGADVTGVDLADKALSAARAHANQHDLSINYLRKDVFELAQEDAGRFDIVICLEMLEHVPEPASVVQACSDLCKPGGDLFFSTINRNLKSYLQAIVAAEYVLRMLEIGTHDYDKFIKPSELEAWCRQAGLNWKHVEGITYNPLTKVYSATASVDVNYLAHCTK